jgi:glycosyltransferase involved in cell wall biosynthesis
MTVSSARHTTHNDENRMVKPTINQYLDQSSPIAPLICKPKLPPVPSADRKAIPGLVSVITTCLNSASTIDRTVDSIRLQDYPEIEYIVIDGGSTDGTVDRLLAATDIIDLLISEPDGGIGDAFNRGISRSHGQYVMLVNSDDWLEPGHLSMAVKVLEDSHANYVFGDLIMHFPDGRPAYIFAGDPSYAAKLSHTMPSMNHPTVVCKRETYEIFGLFDTTLKIAMDYEWFLRVHRGGGHGTYASGLVSHMALGGASIRSFRRSLGEVRKVSMDYGYPAILAWPRFFLRVLKRSARSLLRRLCPDSVYEWMRRKVNGDYRTIGH